MVCTFFGHRNCVELKKEQLYCAIEQTIQEGADMFFVGHQGMFDRAVYACLRKLRESYPQISVVVVLSRLPLKNDDTIEERDTVFPETVEMGLPKFAIDRRNRWMVQQADIVLCYVQRAWGGAYKFADLAAKQGKKVRNLGGIVFETQT